MKYPAINLHKSKSDALIIHCADPRFQGAYRQVIDGLGVYYDLLVMPGASKAVVDNKSVLDSIKLLHDFHHFETIHILDHVECGAFGKVKNELEDHSAYLKKAKQVLKRALPSVEVLPHLLGAEHELIT